MSLRPAHFHGLLHSAHLIARRSGETERRSNVLALIDEGRALLDAIYREWAQIDREIGALVGEEEAEALKDTSLRLRNGLGGRMPGGELGKARRG